jgi:hypothetical protein
MLCIAAFIVLLVLSAVSAKYRKLLGRAWNCTLHRVTFRACDTTFREDIKSSILAPVAVRAPRLVKPASITIEVLAWVMVLSMVVSLYIVGRSGLNLFVYGTCDKQNAQACTLSSQACSIDAAQPGFWQSVGKGDVIGAFGNEFASVGDTIATIPSRLRHWDASDYRPSHATYVREYRSGDPVALEVLDPGCRFCAQLFRNIERSGFDQTHNLTYIAYPIKAETGYKFQNSPLVASYLAAMQLHPLDDTSATDGASADWYVLRQLFTGERADHVDWQDWMNGASRSDATAQLQTWMRQAGYTDAQVHTIAQESGSAQVKRMLAEHRHIVEDRIHTVKIPSLIANGGLHSGLVSADDLKGMKK